MKCEVEVNQGKIKMEMKDKRGVDDERKRDEERDNRKKGVMKI